MGKRAMPKKTTRKSRVFVASSYEAMAIAETIQYNLRDFDADVSVWRQGVFDLSETTVDGLLRAVDAFDFGVFLFAPDDRLRIRSKDHRVARDNVIFEMGLFLGRLGKDRTAIVKPADLQLRLPSDLLGLTTAGYKTSGHDRSLPGRLAPACYEIKRMIQRVGPKKKSRNQASDERRLLIQLQKKVDLLVSITSIPTLATGQAPFKFSPSKMRAIKKIPAIPNVSGALRKK